MSYPGIATGDLKQISNTLYTLYTSNTSMDGFLTSMFSHYLADLSSILEPLETRQQGMDLVKKIVSKVIYCPGYCIYKSKSELHYIMKICAKYPELTQNYKFTGNETLAYFFAESHFDQWAHYVQEFVAGEHAFRFLNDLNTYYYNGINDCHPVNSPVDLIDKIIYTSGLDSKNTLDQSYKFIEYIVSNSNYQNNPEDPEEDYTPESTLGYVYRNYKKISIVKTKYEYNSDIERALSVASLLGVTIESTAGLYRDLADTVLGYL
jgi:hypothetical protein